MSVTCMAAVWKHAKAKGGARLVLLAIADHAKHDGSGAWPSIQTLCTMTRFTERNVRYLLRGLEESGEIQIAYGQGPRGANMYRVTLDGWHPTPEEESDRGAKIAPAKIAPGAKISGRGGKDFRKGGQQLAPDPSLDPSIDPSERGTATNGHRPVPIIVDTFAPTSDDLAWATEQYPDIDLARETESFRYHVRKKGEIVYDWSAAWRSWIMKAPQFASRRNQADINSARRGRVVL